MDILNCPTTRIQHHSIWYIGHVWTLHKASDARLDGSGSNAAVHAVQMQIFPGHLRVKEYHQIVGVDSPQGDCQDL